MPASSALLLLGALLTLSPTEAATYLLQADCTANDCSSGCVNQTPASLSGACFTWTLKKFTCIDNNTKVLAEEGYQIDNCTGPPSFKKTYPTETCLVPLGIINYWWNE